MELGWLAAGRVRMVLFLIVGGCRCGGGELLRLPRVVVVVLGVWIG